MDYQRAPIPNRKLGLLEGYRLLRFIIGIAFCFFLGIGQFISELREPQPDPKAIVLALMISAVSLVLVFALVLIGKRKS
jgi:hypothetical protein